MLRRGDEAAVEALGSSVEQQTAPRWGWHALEHQPGKGWASVFGRRQAQGFLKRKELREPVGSTRYRTDSWGASTRHRQPDAPQAGKRHTPQIARTPVTVRPRIQR